MTDDARIIIPKHIKLQTPKKMVYPKIGDLVMECHNCGCREFGVYVHPVDGTAQVKEVVCHTCGRFYKLDPKARLGGGNITSKRNHDAAITD